MKYCLFESGDVVGPLTAEEISLRSGFGPHTFVCPEEHSEDEAYWKEACAYADFRFEPETSLTEESPADGNPSREKSAQNPPVLSENKADISSAPSQTKAESSLSAARSISAVLLEASEEKNREEPSVPAEKETFSSPEQAPSADAPADTKTEKPAVDFQIVSGAKPSPIEEYFNTIRSGDLGNILGIPDAKENSDMSLSRAMRSQFEKTEPPAGPISEEELKDPFDAFSPALGAPSQTFLDSAQQLFPSQPSKEPENDEPEYSAENTPPSQATAVAQEAGAMLEPLPPQKEEKSAAGTDVSPAPAAVSAEEAQLPLANQKFHSSGNFPAYSAPKKPKTPDAVTTILDGKLDVKKEESDLMEPIKAVEPLGREQTVSSPAAEPPVPSAPVFILGEQKQGKGKRLFFVFGVLILLAGVLLRLSASQISSNSDVSPRPAAGPVVSVPQPAVENIRPEPVVPPLPEVKAPAAPTDPLELSKQVAQRHELGKGRGTVEEYLNKRYAAELAAGYSSAWSSEPLHRNVYVVKYRLAKARKEPIVYIFQTDVSKKKLTGALNNITLDLVGKIRD